MRTQTRQWARSQTRRRALLSPLPTDCRDSRWAPPTSSEARRSTSYSAGSPEGCATSGSLVPSTRGLCTGASAPMPWRGCVHARAEWRYSSSPMRLAFGRGHPSGCGSPSNMTMRCAIKAEIRSHMWIERCASDCAWPYLDASDGALFGCLGLCLADAREHCHTVLCTRADRLSPHYPHMPHAGVESL